MAGRVSQRSEVEPRPRLTRAEQRAATRLAIIEATIGCLVDEGYAGLTTRRVAERVGIAQSTVMHHFETREALLVEAVEHVAVKLAEQTLRRVDLAALRTPERREAALEEMWIEFTSPEALAGAQLWGAVWSEPELTPSLRELEERIGTIILGAARALFPDRAEDPKLPALLDAAVAVIRGLQIAIPVWGADIVAKRWEAIRPLLAMAAGTMLDQPAGK